MTINFSMNFGATFIETYRIPQNTDWETYKSWLDSEVSELKTEIRSNTELDRLVFDLNNCIIKSYEASCKEQTRKQKTSKSWFTPQLAKLRKEVNKLWNRQKKVKEAVKEYKEKLTKYNNERKLAKEKSWLSFCENLSSISSASRIHKVISKDHTNRMGTLKKENGEYTKDMQESLQLLAETHFSGCEQIAVAEEIEIESNFIITDDMRSMFSESSIKWAITSFKPFKSASEDRIFPALLQNGIQILLPVLKKIFIASYALGYIPKAWREVKIIFIPKIGKPSDQPKSYRPISLMSFLLKAMERIIDRSLRDGPLKLIPLHIFQFAYQESKSTTTALKSLVKQIEKSLGEKEICLGCFLDIEGAFDNISFTAIQTALAERNVCDLTINWINCLLRNRNITLSSYGGKKRMKTVKGCPQGGVLSPLLWSLVIDSAIKLLNDKGFGVEGYADDLVILIKGKYPRLVSELMQSALNLIQTWCISIGMNINPGKVSVVPFTRKQKINSRLNTLYIFNKEIHYSNETKYLGVTLDKTLTFNSHLKNVIRKATLSVWTCKRMVSTTWGLTPKIAHWMYTAIVRPMITYASLVWWEKTNQISAQIELDKLQRQACLLMTGGIRTAPAAALFALANLPPLHLFIQSQALDTNYKFSLSELKIVKDNTDPVLNIIQEKHDKQKYSISDYMLSKFNFRSSYNVSIPKREEWYLQYQFWNNDYQIWFTDGSKTLEGTGSGIYHWNTKEGFSYALGTVASVYQAELYAIELCVRNCIEKQYFNQKIFIYSDSQAALKSLSQYKVTSKLVWSCMGLLEELAKNNQVHLVWVPGHSNIVGNEKADEMARIGSSTSFVGPEPFCGYSISNVNIGKTWLSEQLEDYWTHVPNLRHSKLFIKGFDQKLSLEFLNLTRKQARLLTMFLTGHGYFNKYLKMIGKATEDKCRLCGDIGETAEHLLCDCEALSCKRYNTFGKPIMEPVDFWCHSLKDILRFINDMKIEL